MERGKRRRRPTQGIQMQDMNVKAPSLDHLIDPVLVRCGSPNAFDAHSALALEIISLRFARNGKDIDATACATKSTLPVSSFI